MSAEHVSWVYRHSAAKGPAFQVHQAVADSCNDAYDHEFFMRLGRLAEKARVSRPTAQRAVAWLLENGYLDLLSAEDRKRAGHPAHYRFLFPDVPVVFETRASRPQREGVYQRARGGSRSEREEVPPTARPITTQGDPNSGTQPESLAPSPSPRGSRIPAPFVVDVAMRTWAAEQCPNVDYHAETEKFCDYWRGRAGSGGVKADWPATWRNWLRRAEEGSSRGSASGKGRGASAAAGIMAQLRQEATS